MRELTGSQGEPEAPAVASGQHGVPEVNGQGDRRLAHVVHHAGQHHGNASQAEHEGPVTDHAQKQHAGDDPEDESGPASISG